MKQSMRKNRTLYVTSDVSNLVTEIFTRILATKVTPMLKHFVLSVSSLKMHSLTSYQMCSLQKTCEWSRVINTTTRTCNIFSWNKLAAKAALMIQTSIQQANHHNLVYHQCKSLSPKFL